MPVPRILLMTLATGFLALSLAPTAAAHASANSADGAVRVTWGFLDEPAYTHQKLRLDLIIRKVDTMAGIPASEIQNVTATLIYGDESYDFGAVNPYRGAKSGGAFAGDGNYTGANPVYLTREGIYTLHVRGTIAGSEVDLRIPATHEYRAMSDVAFPDNEAFPASGDTSALEARIAALEQQVEALRQEQQTQSSTPASVTGQTPPAEPNGVPAAGVLLAALGALAAALLLRQKA